MPRWINDIFPSYCLVFYPKASTFKRTGQVKLKKASIKLLVLQKEKGQIRGNANHFGE